MAGLVAAAPGITGIVHLAAQAGVRHSMVDPYAYVAANVMGHLVMLEAARQLKGLRHLVYASSSLGLRRQPADAVRRGRTGSTRRSRSTPRPSGRTS